MAGMILKNSKRIRTMFSSPTSQKVKTNKNPQSILMLRHFSQVRIILTNHMKIETTGDEQDDLGISMYLSSQMGGHTKFLPLASAVCNCGSLSFSQVLMSMIFLFYATSTL